MGIRRGNWINKGIEHSGEIKSNIKAVGNNSPKTPIIGVGSKKTANSLSEFRQNMIKSGNEDESGNIAPIIVFSPSYKRTQNLIKSAATSVSGAGSTFGSSSTSPSTVRQAPEIYSPLFQMANLQLPRDRITMNAWNRNFYTTHPLVHNCINLHATYPISKISIKCKEQKIEQFFNEMAQDMDLVGILQSMAQEYWIEGECFPYAQLNESSGTWDKIEILNPDYIHVKKSPLGDFSVSMRPDAALLRLVQSSNPDDIRLTKRMDPEIVYHIRKGNNIPLDNFHISHLKMLAAPYDIHGTSILVSIYKDLMLYDQIREAKFAQAGNMINPITLVKVGGTEEGEMHPTANDLENYRQVFESAQYDRDFKIITHAGVKVERVGASGQIIDIAPDMDFIMNNIMYGLMVPKNILIQEGAGFQSASIGLEVLKQRYESFRNMMAQWLIRKIFAPISEIQEFYTYKDGEKKLIVPEVDWNQMVLYDMDNYINAIKELANNPENPVVSKETLFRSLGLNIDEEQRRIKQEAIRSIIFKKEIGILQEMSLGALRTLKGDTDIIETTTTPLPGTPGAEVSPEESGTMDLGLGGGPETGGIGGGGGLGGLGLTPQSTTPTSKTPPAAPSPSPTTPGPAPAKV